MKAVYDHEDGFVLSDLDIAAVREVIYTKFKVSLFFFVRWGGRVNGGDSGIHLHRSGHCFFSLLLLCIVHFISISMRRHVWQLQGNGIL